MQTRAQELTEAGLRILIGETTPHSLLDLWLDWLGNPIAGGLPTPTATPTPDLFGSGTPEPTASPTSAVTGFDAGFDEIMRGAGAGHDLEKASIFRLAG